MFLLDWINPEEFLSLVVLICILAFIGGQMTRPDSETYRNARRITAGVFLLYSGMGIYAWGPSGATELFVIILRAVLAAGVAFGLALVTLTPAAFLISQAKALIPPKPRPRAPEPPKLLPLPAATPRDAAAEERAEKERMSKIDDARTEATQFYEKNQQLLEESLPSALFRSQLRTRFPEGIAPERAWTAAEQMIAEMLPLIAKAREHKRAEQEEERKRVEQAKEDERKRKETEARGNAFQKLAEWYQREQETIRQSLPEGLDQEEALRELFGRYDQLMKETYAEMKP
jgi:hypothetical protein